MALDSIRTRANIVRSGDFGNHGIRASSSHAKVSNQPTMSNTCGLYIQLQTLSDYKRAHSKFSSELLLPVDKN